MDTATHGSRSSKSLPIAAWRTTSDGGHFQITYYLMTCFCDGHLCKLRLLWEMTAATLAVVCDEIAKHKPRYRLLTSYLSLWIKTSWNGWQMKTNLMSLAILFHLLCAQHISDINISIFRSLRLCWWITTSVVLFSVRCVLEIWCGWYLVVFVLQAKLLMMDILMSETCWAHNKWNKIASDIKLVFHSSTVTMMHGPINIRLCHLNLKGVSTNVGCCKSLTLTDVYLYEEFWEMNDSDVTYFLVPNRTNWSFMLFICQCVNISW